MTKISRYNSGAPWEAIVGYSRAVKAGAFIEVAGTTAVNEHGAVVGLDDPYAQSLFIFEKIAEALKYFDADMSQVIRTRIYVTDINQWEAIGKAHQQFFATSPPAATMVEVKSLINPHLLVEIEATAYVG